MSLRALGSADVAGGRRSAWSEVCRSGGPPFLGDGGGRLGRLCSRRGWVQWIKGIPCPDLRWLVGRATTFVASDDTGLEVLQLRAGPGDDYGVAGCSLARDLGGFGWPGCLRVLVT